MQDTQYTEGNTSGLRSFMVLMDKNQDTQWIEDGKFVDNPIPKPELCANTISRLFSELTGLPFVKEVQGVIVREGVTQYTVYGYRYASDSSNDLIKRTVTIHV
jgi:hypothetical protein